ncbi:hypothetical protein KFE25_010994 [Diacronema lutheri]|uniref:DUF938 domain-containing protein n=2 Tax=Diacronema lutheri TaxID=2081491 RepID=A0A8J5XB21_DIALT|nr:hypothetical protein KFE25_010994 [Diacronema lutheri]
MSVTGALSVFLRMAATIGGASAVHHPAALRNRLPIVEGLREFGFGELVGPALEVASGTGAHIEVLAPAFTSLTWLPTEYVSGQPSAPAFAGAAFDESMRALETIDLYGSSRFANVRPAAALDASLPFEQWPAPVVSSAGQHQLVLAVNICHIAPWGATCGLITGASRALAPAGSLVIYGPFKVGGVCEPESNAQFDRSLRERNHEWGIRDVEALASHAGAHGMALHARKAMPANNFLLRFVKQAIL